MIALPSIAFEEMSGSAKGVTAAKVKSRHRHPCRLRGQERRSQRCGSEDFFRYYYVNSSTGEKSGVMLAETIWTAGA